MNGARGKRRVEEDHVRKEDMVDEEGDMGEFEDAWDDEIEEDNIVMDGDCEDDFDANGDGDEGMADVGGECDTTGGEGVIREEVRAYVPGQDELAEGDELVRDNSAYDMFHASTVEWPCLSFDILKDSSGDIRTKYPMTSYLVAGSSADTALNNRLYVIKMSRLHKTKYDNEDSDNDSGDDMDVDGDDTHVNKGDNDRSVDPIMNFRALRHNGGVNRVRASVVDGQQMVASWADTGKVHLWNLTAEVNALDPRGGAPLHSEASVEPVYTFGGHAEEGFAMDWSRKCPGRLITGDCKKHIYLTTVNQGSFTTDKVPFSGHSKSVEDLQWSPNEMNVFSSCSVDRSVRFWDVRKKAGSALTIPDAHDADVNVISWNPTVSHLLVSGGDDGLFKIWDLRNLKANVSTPAGLFKWHKAPITSVEWHPSDESVLAVAGADDQVTLWDLSLEKEVDTFNEVDAGEPDVPPQLLFIHQGQTDVKEIHWHKQLPGVVLSTAASGLNIFKSVSV